MTASRNAWNLSGVKRSKASSKARWTSPELCCSRSVPGRRVQSHTSHRCPQVGTESMAPTVKGPESDFTVTASPPAPLAASTPEATRRRSQTSPASNRPLNKDATDARGGEDRGREDRGAGREGVPEVVAEREGRTATNGRGQRTDPPRCSPSPLPADPARPFAHDERSCLRRWAQHPQVSLPPKQCTANVRARRPELLSVPSTPLPMCARGGGEVRALSRRS